MWPDAVISQEGRKCIEADHTTAARQGQDLIVRLVPGIVAKLARVGMREGQRPFCNADRMLDRFVAHMGKVNGDPGVL